MKFRSFAFWICPLLVCFLAFLGCSKEERSFYNPSAAPLTGDPAQENCGFDPGEEVPNGPIIDPCGDEAFPVHGPVTLTPSPSLPAHDTVELIIPAQGFICVTVTLDKIANATVTLNGEPLFEPRDFNAKVGQLNRFAAVEEGEAVLEFEVLATKHGSFTYEVSYIPLDPVPRGEVSGNNNRLSVYNLRDHPDPFSPEKQDGIRDTVTMNVTASVAREGISPRSANEYIVYGTFEIASPDTCQEIARLTTQLTLAEATPTSTDRDYVVPLTVVWDGRDNSGAFVDGGTYFYRAVAELVKISPPGSSQLLDMAYSEILTVTNDDIPPEITISPANGEEINTDMPLITIGYADEGSGVDKNTLHVLLNGMDVTDKFQATETQATSQVTIDWYLEEGNNILSVALSDNAGNWGGEFSSFDVNTSTEILLEGLENPDHRYVHRSSYKLVCRFDELAQDVLRRCLNHLNNNPEPKAVDCIVQMLQTGVTDYLSMALAAGAYGEAVGKNPTKVEQSHIVVLGTLLSSHTSHTTRLAVTRALGFSRDTRALAYLEDYYERIDHFQTNPDRPNCIVNPYDCLQFDAAMGEFKLQLVRAITMIAGQGYQVGNPGDLMEIRAKALEEIKNNLGEYYGNGGAP